MMDMEANDNRGGPAFEERKAFLGSLIKNLQPGPDGRAAFGAVIRELEQMRPGLIEQAFARQTAHRLGLDLRTRHDTGLPDLSFLDYADA